MAIRFLKVKEVTALQQNNQAVYTRQFTTSSSQLLLLEALICVSVTTLMKLKMKLFLV